MKATNQHTSLLLEREDMQMKYTFTDFLASRHYVTDHLDDGTEETGKSGFVYGESFWIRDNRDGTFYLMIERSEYTSRDLARLEELLWEFAGPEINSTML